MRPLAPLVALLLVLCATVARAGDVEIRLTSGERVFGELIADSPDTVTINRKVWTKSGMIAGRAEYARTRIAAMEQVTSLDDLAKKRAAESSDTFADQFSLAKWCFDRGLQDQAFTVAKKLYDRDPTDEVAKDLMGELGYILDDGQWLKEADYAAKHGLVIYDGKLLTPAQVDLRKAEMKADVDRDNAVAKQRGLDAAEATAERRVADAKARVDKLKQQQAEVKQQEAQAKQAQRQQQGRNGGRNQQPQQPQAAQQPATIGAANDYAEQIKQLDKAIADAQKSVDDANKSLQAAKDAQAKGKDAVDAAQKAVDTAHQAVLDSMPKDAAKDPAKDDKTAAKPADPAKPATPK